MSPAFSSLRQAVGFVLLLLVLLLLPAIVPRSALPAREQIYQTLPWNLGPFPFIHDQIYKEKGDVDIAFIGASQTWAAVDTPELQRKLSEKLGRPATVITLGYAWAGFDGVYFIARDLLQHRKVHMIVFADSSGLGAVQQAPHKQSWRWLRWAEDKDETEGLPWKYRLNYYYGTILGMPRNLLGMIHPNGEPILTPEKQSDLETEHHWIMPTDRLGTLSMKVGFNDRPDLFVPFNPQTTANASEFEIYSSDQPGKFQFAETPENSIQVYFARKLAAICREHNTELINLYVPLIEDRRSAVIPERYNWPKALQSKVDMIGIPPAELFEGLPDSDIGKLYWDPYHFNANGQRYFTQLLAPKLFELYDDTAKN